MTGHYWTYLRHRKNSQGGEWEQFIFPTRRAARAYKAGDRQQNKERRLMEDGSIGGNYFYRYTGCMMVRAKVSFEIPER